VLRTGVRPVEQGLRREVDRLYEVARESVSAVWPLVKALVEALLVQEEVDRDGVDRAIGDADVVGPCSRCGGRTGCFELSRDTLRSVRGHSCPIETPEDLDHEPRHAPC
jgi:hypothetical protein